MEVKIKHIFIILFLTIFIMVPKAASCFKPEIHNYYTKEERGNYDYGSTPEEIKNAIYKTKLETDKKNHVKGEPILYMISLSPVTYCNGSFLGVLRFSIKKGNKTIQLKDIDKYSERLFKFAGIKRKYIIVPSSIGNIFKPECESIYHARKAYFSYATNKANIFTYFADSSFQTDIKPGRYILKAEFIKRNDKFSTILPCSTVINIENVPDSEMAAFKLLKHKKYDEIVRRYPKSVYAPYSSFKGLIDRVYAYYRLPKSKRTKEMQEDIENRLYCGVRDYPEYYAGEIGVVKDIFWSVIYQSFIIGTNNIIYEAILYDTIPEEAESYFDKFRNLKDNEMAQFMAKHWIKHHESVLKFTRGRVKRFSEETKERIRREIESER